MSSRSNRYTIRLIKARSGHQPGSSCIPVRAMKGLGAQDETCRRHVTRLILKASDREGCTYGGRAASRVAHYKSAGVSAKLRELEPTTAGIGEPRALTPPPARPAIEGMPYASPWDTII
jgi:hypothetical protein